MQTPSLYALLAGSVDYAGLFPPAQMDMRSAVRNYRTYRQGSHAWALGRFILPASRLPEYESAVSELPQEKGTTIPWPLSVLVGPEAEKDVQAVRHWNGCRDGTARVESIELKATTPEEIGRLRRYVPESLAVYVEVPLDDSLQDVVRAIAEAGVRAKVRTGGVAPEVFPSAASLARFVRECAGAAVSFKATAGLHHPLRARYALTYDPAGPVGVMFGFLNVFLAGLLAFGGADVAEIASALEDGNKESFRFGEDTLEWRGRRVNLQEIRAVRRDFVLSFGSCSFEEPLDDLQRLGFI